MFPWAAVVGLSTVFSVHFSAKKWTKWNHYQFELSSRWSFLSYRKHGKIYLSEILGSSNHFHVILWFQWTWIELNTWPSPSPLKRCVALLLWFPYFLSFTGHYHIPLHNDRKFREFHLLKIKTCLLVTYHNLLFFIFFYVFVFLRIRTFSVAFDKKIGSEKKKHTHTHTHTYCLKTTPSFHSFPRINLIRQFKKKKPGTEQEKRRNFFFERDRSVLAEFWF